MVSKMRNVLILLPMLLAVALFGCHKDTEQEKITRILHLIQAGVESKKAMAVLDHVSKNYRDPQGNDYEAVKGLLLFYFFRHQRISVVMTGLEIQVHVAAADARFEAILSARSGQSSTILPETLDAYRFNVFLAKDAGEWKVTSAKWEPFSGEAAASP